MRRRALGVTLARPLARQDVAGNLLAQEFIVRLVGVERVDHVVSITPGGGHRIVGRLTSGVGIANDIEPVASPVLAVMRRVEQSIHNLLESTR